MNKKLVVISAVLAVVFDLIACIGDSNEAIYNIFMGLCCAAFCVYVYGLFRVGYTTEKHTAVNAADNSSSRKVA